MAASLLRVIYAMVRDGTPYRSLGPDHFDTLDHERKKRHYLSQLEKLGYNIMLQETA